MKRRKELKVIVLFPLKNLSFLLSIWLVESLKWKYKTLKKNAIFQVSFYIFKVKVVFSKKVENPAEDILK